MGRLPSRQRRWPRRLVSLLLAATTLPAQAAIQQVLLEVHADGTPGFDPQDGPGLDRDAHNLIVRTHDELTYRVTLSANSAEKDIVIELELPRQQPGNRPLTRWSYVPQECRSGSQISGDGQKLACRLGDFSHAGTRSVLFGATVQGTAGHGERLSSPTVRVASASTPGIAPAHPAADVRVSAAPFYDVELALSSHGSPAAHGFLARSGPDGQDGFFHRPLVGLIARNPHGHGRKGVEALDPRTPVEIELSLAGYPASVRVNDWAVRTRPPQTPANNSFTDGCGSPNLGGPGTLGGAGFGMTGRVRDTGPRASTDPHNVSNGGDCRVLASDRERVLLSISGIDASLQRRPTTYWRGGAIPADHWWVANKGLVLWTDETDYPDGERLLHRLQLLRLTGRSISGQALIEGNPDNDRLQYPIRHDASAQVALQYIVDQTLPRPYASVGDPRSSGQHQVNHLAPGQVLTTALRLWNNGTRSLQDNVLCQVIDRTAFDLGPGFSVQRRGAGGPPRFRYGARPGQSPHFASTDSAAAALDGRNRPVPGNSAYMQARCDDPGIQWFDTAAAAEAAGGLVHVEMQIGALAPGQVSLLDIRGLRLRHDWAATIQVQTPTPQQRLAGSPIRPGTVLRSRGEVRSRTMPRLATGRGYWDHLEVVDTRTTSRIAAAFTQPANATSTPVPAGSTLALRLTPRYSTLYPPRAHAFGITAILPPGLRHVPGSARIDGKDAPPVIRHNSPATGMTTLSWQLPERLPHVGPDTDAAAALPVVDFQARTSQTLADGTRLRVQAAVNAGPDDADADCPITATGFGACAKSASVDTTVQTPPGFFLEKSVSREQIEPGEAFDYTISFVSVGGEIQNIDLPDIIDILPFAGDGQSRPEQSFSGRQPASRLIPGAYRLTGIIPSPLDPQARLHYTRRPHREIHNDPRHASNQLPGGSTRWCLASEFGSAGCPADIGDSTAIRVRPALASLPANTPYEIDLQLQADPVRARDGDLFANRAGSRPVAPGSRLLYVESQAGLQVAVSLRPGSLAGQLFADTNRNGRRDDGEWPLPAQCIQLSGTTGTGQPVSISTRSGNDGHYRFGLQGSQPVFHSHDCSGTPLADFAGLPPGTYTLEKPASTTPHSQRDGLARAGTLGGQVQDNRIGGIEVGRGAEGSGYDFTEWPVPPTITLEGTVRNDHGGQADPATLRLSLEGNGLKHEGGNGDEAITGRTVPAGTYTLGHVPLPGYRAGSWQCTINGQARSRGTQLSLTHGDEARCSLEVDDLPARLILQASVTNSHGRTARPADFMLHAHGPVTLSGASGSAAITGAEVSGGRYVLGHTPRPGYVTGAWQCSAGTLVDDTLSLAQGEDATCTLNHTDQPVSLTLVLAIDNRHGGTARPDDLPLSAQGPDPIRGITGTRPVTVAPVRPGVYELGEPRLPGYLSGKWVCSAGRLEGNTLILSEQQNVTCRVELKDIPPSFETRKRVLGPPVPVSGTEGDFLVDYEIGIRHTGGADGIYRLLDQPAFDPDVQVTPVSLTRNGQPIEVVAGHDGGWQLAEQRRLAIAAEDIYRLTLRLRIPFGSTTRNDRCQGGSQPVDGHGLLNRVVLQARGLESPQDAHACVDTPVPALKAQLSIDKRSPERHAELGDLVRYQLRIRNHGQGPALRPVIIDRLPAGFRLDPGSVRVQHARLLQSSLTHQRELRLTLDRVDHDSRQDIVISYRLRAGVGAQEGDGINRVHIECPDAHGQLQACSNEARWQVRVDGGILGTESCLAGQIFVDCNRNSAKDPDEPGIPGVRLYLANGTWLQSDAQGRYSHCGLRPRTHVLKLDERTLPRKSRMVTSSAQNGGDALSLFVDTRKGMLHRADFIEGSCSPGVLDEVKARQAGSGNTGLSAPVPASPVHFDSQRTSRPPVGGR